MVTDEEAIRLGHKWFTEHEAHVRKVIDFRARASAPVEPTGSDKAKPELWKDIHWMWFFQKTGRDL